MFVTLPEEFKKRMQSLLGEEYKHYELAVTMFNPVKAFRVNTEKISVEDFEKINPYRTDKIPYVHNGFYLDIRPVDTRYLKLRVENNTMRIPRNGFGFGIGNNPLHHAGMIYIQEPAAMMPAECIDVGENWKILDMCAAPGGKSTQLKNKLGEKGVLVSNEIIPSRCKILTGNIERLGLKNCVTTCMDTKKLANTFPDTFDLIMVDAPCSGEGMFRKEEQAVKEWSTENVLMCAERQKGILENAVTCLKDGGYIIYATCTFSLEENEMVIDDFLSKHPEFELVQVKQEIIEKTCDGIEFEGCKCKNINFARRFYPHKALGEGQFAAVLKSTLEPGIESKKKKSIPEEKVDKLVFDFLDSTLTSYDKSSVRMYNGNPVFYSGDLEIKKGTAFSCGVTIGEIKKGYIQPHHQFFMAMGDHFKRKIELEADGEEVVKYLHGEEIDADTENGWAVVTTCGCSLGGVKVNNKKAKNHYPKGLRLKF